jgi:hypothetical protein
MRLTAIFANRLEEGVFSVGAIEGFHPLGIERS